MCSPPTTSRENWSSSPTSIRRFRLEFYRRMPFGGQSNYPAEGSQNICHSGRISFRSRHTGPRSGNDAMDSRPAATFALLDVTLSGFRYWQR